MDIEQIRQEIRNGTYRFSDHAIKRMIKRSIIRSEVEEAIISGEIIEEYPDDKYAPSCLIFGETRQKRSLHVQASLPPTVVIVTCYEPNPEDWIEGKIRR